MNWKRFIICVAAAYIFVFFYEWVVHGILLMDTYEQTSQLWRSPEAMQSLFGVSVVIGVLFIAVLCYIFTRNFEDRGIAEGVRFGVMFGVLFGLFMASWYVILPISASLAVIWFFVSTIEMIGVGIIFALVYKKPPLTEQIQP